MQVQCRADMKYDCKRRVDKIKRKCVGGGEGQVIEEIKIWKTQCLKKKVDDGLSLEKLNRLNS